MNNNPLADNRAFTQCDTGMDHRASSDRDVVVHSYIRMNVHVVAHKHIATDHDACANRHARGNTRSRINHSGRVNERLELSLRMENPQRARVRKIRIFHTQDRDLPIRLRLFTQIDRGRARRINPRRISRVSEKRHLPLAGLIQPRRPSHFYIVVSFQARPRQFRKF